MGDDLAVGCSNPFRVFINCDLSLLQAPNFLNESCHSSYNNTAYYSDGGSCSHSFDTGPTHHSLLLEYPTTGQPQLEDHQDRASGGRASYSCEQNIQLGSSCIQLLADSIFPGVVDLSGAHINGDHMAGNEDKGMDDSIGVVQVRIQCADEEVDSARTKAKFEQLGHDLLQPTLYRTSSPPSSCGSVDSIGSPTPTPSYGGLTSSATVETSSATLEYPGAEQKAYAVRGSEVAQLEEWEERQGNGGTEVRGV